MIRACSRSLPDPKLTFEAYIAGTITSLMPGLMADIPGPGKLSARAQLATAQRQARETREARHVESHLVAATSIDRDSGVVGGGGGGGDFVHDDHAMQLSTQHLSATMQLPRNSYDVNHDAP